MFDIRHSVALLGISCFLSIAVTAHAADEVNIYTTRLPSALKPVLDAFTHRTGVKTNLMYLPRGLVERTQVEGQNSPADVILGLSLDRLQEADAVGITQPVADARVISKLAAKGRDPSSNWLALSTRAVVIGARADAVTSKSMAYDELADPKWKGKICILSGQHDDNIGLFASMLARLGPDKAKSWLAGLVSNQAMRPDGVRYASMADLVAGHCDLALGNSQQAGLFLKGNADTAKSAASIKVLMPSRDAGGPYVDVSGMALARNAPNKDNALKLMTFLASKEGRGLVGEALQEMPIGQASGGPKVKGVIAFKAKPDAAMVARYRKAAADLADQVGFDDSLTDE